MIYTVTFNPSLDYIVSVPGFEMGKTNRTVYEQMLAGGKGINVTTVLGNLGIESTALGYVAGFTGEELVRRMEEMGLKNDLSVSAMVFHESMLRSGILTGRRSTAWAL